MAEKPAAKTSSGKAGGEDIDEGRMTAEAADGSADRKIDYRADRIKNRRWKTSAKNTASGGWRWKLRRKSRRWNIGEWRTPADRGEDAETPWRIEEKTDCRGQAEVVGDASMPKVGVGTPKKLRNATREFRSTTVSMIPSGNAWKTLSLFGSFNQLSN